LCYLIGPIKAKGSFVRINDLDSQRKNEDAHSFEREGIKTPHIVAGGMVALLLGFLLSYFQIRSTEKDKPETNHNAVL
jgi:hypothetical protein